MHKLLFSIIIILGYNTQFVSSAYADNKNTINTITELNNENIHKSCLMPHIADEFQKSNSALNDFNKNLNAITDYEYEAPAIKNQKIYNELLNTDKILAKELNEKSEYKLNIRKLQFTAQRYINALDKCTESLNNPAPIDTYINVYTRIMTANLWMIDEVINKLNVDVYDLKSLERASAFVNYIDYNQSLYQIMQRNFIINKYNKFKKHFEIANAQSYGEYQLGNGGKCLVRDSDTPLQIKSLNISDIYPKNAIKDKILVQIFGVLRVDTKGNVTITSLTSSNPIFITNKLRSLISNLKYRPAIKDCIPYASDAPIRIEFSIEYKLKST